MNFGVSNEAENSTGNRRYFNLTALPKAKGENIGSVI